MRRVVERRVISLEGSSRLPGFMTQPDAAGFEVWDAFDGRTGAGAEWFDDVAYEARVGENNMPGEIGCTISHLRLMEHFGGASGAADDVLLVAEDDVLFAPDFAAVCQRILQRSNFGCVVMANGLRILGTARSGRRIAKGRAVVVRSAGWATRKVDVLPRGPLRR